MRTSWVEVNIQEDRNLQGNASSIVLGHQAAARLPLNSELDELVTDDDLQEEDECEHFTIRGYVSKVRKIKDAKICCPFTMLQNHNCDENHGGGLPPLPVTKFRWWNCQNCLDKKTYNRIYPKSYGSFMRNFQKGKEIKKGKRSISFPKSQRINHEEGKLRSFVSINSVKENGSVLKNVNIEGTQNPTSIDVGLTTVPVRMSERIPTFLDQTARIGSGSLDIHVEEFNASLTADTHQSFLNGSNENSRHGKAPKVRALSDIINSEISLSKKSMEMNLSKPNKYEANKNGSRTTTVKGVTKNSYKQKHHLAMKKILLSTMNEKEEETLEKEGEESLMQSPKKLSYKNIFGHKKYLKIQSVSHLTSSDAGGATDQQSKKHVLQIKSPKPSQILGAEKVPGKVSNEQYWPILSGEVDERSNYHEKETFSQGEFGQEASDDFPMDIVELLARNRHEKRIKDLEVAASNLHNLSEVAEIMKNNNILDTFKAPRLKGDVARKKHRQKNAKINQREGRRPMKTDHDKPKDPSMLDNVERKKLQPCQSDEVCSNLGHLEYAQGTCLKVSNGVCERSILGPINQIGGFHPHMRRELDLEIHKEINMLHNVSPFTSGKNDFVLESAASPLNIYKVDAISPPIEPNINQVNCELYGSKTIGRRACLQDGEGTSNTSGNGFRPFRPLPRLGVLGPLLQDELTSRSASWRTAFALNSPPGSSSKIITSFRVDEEKGEVLPSTDISNSWTSFCPECGSSILMASLQQPLAECPSPMIEAKKDEVGGASESKCTESCVVNRNPADFTTVGEDNEYMIIFNKLRIGYVPVIGIPRFQSGHGNPRRQKRMKLTSIKEFMRR